MQLRMPRAGRWWLGVTVLATIAGFFPGAAVAADLPATPTTLASAFNAAQPGDRILLASGSYGTFTGGMKSGMVTLTPAPGATASMALKFSPASNITIDGLTITDSEMSGAQTKNIVVRNSSFDHAQAIFRTGSLQNANILLDHNTHVGFVKCSGCGEGRVWFPEKTSQPAGITIENSYFAGGNSDGIQTGANGVKIVDNEFTGIHQIDSGAGVHADSIQLYGSSNTLIRGNYFHDVADCIMSPDGADHEVIEDNVCVTDGYPYAFTIESDNGSIIRHNTLAAFSTTSGGGCEYNLPCGIVRLGSKSGQPAGTGTTIQDNILAQIDVPDGAQSYAFEGYNLSTHRKGAGTGDLLGSPAYSGGARPATFAGFALATGSLGARSASDGTDRGAAVTGGDSTPTPTPTPIPTPEPTPTPTAAAQAIWTAPANAVTGKAVTLDGTRSKGLAPLGCTWSFEDQTGSAVWSTKTGCKVSMTFTSAGAKYVRLIVRGADGATSANKQTINVKATSSSGPKAGTTTTTTTTTTQPATSVPAGTTASPPDVSGQGNTARISGARAPSSGRTGKALRFRGRADAISIPAAALAAAGSGFTLEAWVKPVARRAARRTLVLRRGGHVVTVPAPAALARSRWSHVVIAFGPRRSAMYVDGTRLATVRRGAALLRGAGRLTIGRDARGRGFRGLLDDVRVYSRTLTPVELRALA